MESTLIHGSLPPPTCSILMICPNVLVPLQRQGGVRLAPSGRSPIFFLSSAEGSLKISYLSGAKRSRRKRDLSSSPSLYPTLVIDRSTCKKTFQYATRWPSTWLSIKSFIICIGRIINTCRVPRTACYRTKQSSAAGNVEIHGKGLPNR